MDSRTGASSMYGTMQERRRRATRRITVICMMAGFVQACGGGHELEQYSFAGATLAVVDYPAPVPDLWTGAYDVDRSDLVTALVDAGSRAAREVEARRARARLDSAAHFVDVRERMSQWTLERASRYLGASPVSDPATADYLLEIYVRQFGIDARGGRPAQMFMKVEAVLLDRRTGYEAWNVVVSSNDRLTPGVRGGGPIPVDVVTAATLHTLTVAQLRAELAGLTDFTADYLTNELREDLRDMRRR